MAKQKLHPLRHEEAGRYADLCRRPNGARLKIVFSPSLAALLVHAEREKGADLTSEEVIRIRDNAPAIAVTAEQAAALEADRGYADVDPERALESWREMNTT